MGKISSNPPISPTGLNAIVVWYVQFQQFSIQAIEPGKFNFEFG